MSIICSEPNCDVLVEFKCDCLSGKIWCCTHYSAHIRISNCSSVCIRDYVTNQIKRFKDYENTIKKFLAESIRRGEYLMLEIQRMVSLQVKKILNKLKIASNFKYTGELEDLSEINNSNNCENFYEDFHKIIEIIIGAELNHNKSYKELVNEISYLKENSKEVLKDNQASKVNFENQVLKLNSIIKDHSNTISNFEKKIEEIKMSSLKKSKKYSNRINEQENTIKEQSFKIVSLEEKNSEILKYFKEKENDFISKEKKLNDNILTLQTKNEDLAESIKSLNSILENYKELNNMLTDDIKILEEKNLELENEIAKLKNRLNFLQLSQKIEKSEPKKTIKKYSPIVLEYLPCNKSYFLNPLLISMSNLIDFITIYKNTTNQFLNSFFNILHLFSSKKFKDIEMQIQNLHSQYSTEIAQNNFDSSKDLFVVLNVISRLIKINYCPAYQTFAIRSETLPFNIGKCSKCNKNIVLNEIDLIDELPYLNVNIPKDNISANDIGNSLIEFLYSDDYFYKCRCGYISSYKQKKYASFSKYLIITIKNESKNCNLRDIITVNREGFSLKLKSIITSNMVYLQEKLEWTSFGSQAELFSGNTISSIKMLVYEVII
ncbi:hypothetical protein SteCoe_17182 [Stentor coeruleus]|uniref:Uncharacterized protein n=1 Tax=Stentor coeruleus TaxID=5963 RepID=A0A1R2BZE8_9CILI|nr:hypothetical protein SteCoe_17182 [Stentor coeruleus]